MRRVLPLLAVLSLAFAPAPVSKQTPQLYPIHLNGKMGYMNRSGKVVIPPTFDNAWAMSEGYGNVMIGWKRGLIDDKGRMLIRPQFRYDDGLGNVQEGHLHYVDDEGRHGFLDPRGNGVIPAKFQYAMGFSQGLAPAMSGKQFGYIDKTGKFVIRPQFDYAWPFQQGFACVRVDDELLFIDKAGLPVFAKKFGYAYSFSEGFAAVNQGGRPPSDPKDEIGGRWGFIDRKGTLVIEAKFHDVLGYSEGVAGVNIGTRWKGQWGFIDKAGSYIVEPSYRWVGRFSEGFAAVANDDWKYGYIDKTGRVVIPPRFDSAEAFSGGIAQVGLGAIEVRKYGYIDKTGTFIWKLTR